MYEVKAIVRPEMLEAVIHRLHAIEQLPGIAVFSVHGHGRRASHTHTATEYADVRMAQVELVVPEALVDPVVDAIGDAAATGRTGDGKIFVLRVERVAQIGARKAGFDAS
jgi:nitrogen regulatory protein PII